MEGNNPTKQQQQIFIKKEPLRVRSYSSLRQHEQQQLAASLRSLRGPPGVSVHPRELPVKRDAMSGSVVTPQKHPVRSLVSFPTNTSSSNGGTGADGVKFMPNVSFKPNTPTTTTGTTYASAESSGFGVESLLLRAIHSRQPTQQNPQRFGRPKFEGPVRHACDSLQTQQRQNISIEFQKENNTKKDERRTRSIKLSDLAHDESHGNLFLPITIPFKQQQQQQHGKAEKEISFGLGGKAQHEQELQEIDTAASTPNHVGRNKSTKPTAEQIINPFIHDKDTPAASLLRDQFVLRGNEHLVEQDGTLDFVQLCFPEFLPPLDISALEARQLETKQQKTNKDNPTRISNNSRENVPTPLHALPSGRIGQLYIHRSGRVHLRLLTDASRKSDSKSDATAEEENTEEQQGTSGDAAKRQNNGDISYEVLVGTEGSFAQEVGCLLSETNEFVFLGRCTRKLIITADISRAFAPPKQRNL